LTPVAPDSGGDQPTPASVGVTQSSLSSASLGSGLLYRGVTIARKTSFALEQRTGLASEGLNTARVFVVPPPFKRHSSG
jgi:hypothetical protein